MSLLHHNEFEKRENFLRGIANRVLQLWALIAPGASTLRVWLHRARGVKIGRNVLIGYDTIIDSSSPDLVSIADNCFIGMRVTIIAHFKEARGIRIEEGAFIGPGSIILPNVVIGHGAVVAAGSVVTHSVAPMTIVQGNPATPVAESGIVFSQDVSLTAFSLQLRPLSNKACVGEKKTTVSR
jgi:acetyltransferase-like isoleucine patch superfamily enzyme